MHLLIKQPHLYGNASHQVITGTGDKHTTEIYIRKEWLVPKAMQATYSSKIFGSLSHISVRMGKLSSHKSSGNMGMVGLTLL